MYVVSLRRGEADNGVRDDQPNTQPRRSVTKNLTIEDYSMTDLLDVARSAKPAGWKLHKHPKRDAFTLYGPSGFVIHPDLGFINDENDAAFMSMFDPAMVLSILERLAELEERA